MKIKIIFSFLALLLSACAAAPTTGPNRGIAQVDENAQNQEKIFQDLWASPTPGTEFSKQVNRVVSLYYRAQQFLIDFDQEQNGDISALNRSEPYRKLQVIREMQEEQVELVVFLYGRLIDMQQSGEPEAKKKAGAVLSNFARYMLLNRNKLQRLAMQDMVRELRAARQQKAAELEGVEFRAPEEITAFLDDKEGTVSRREALIAAARKESVQADHEFDAALEQAEKSESKAQREPQSEINYFPNAGQSGNLFGHELPMGTFALTFDDGPSLVWTPKILANLRANGQQTTFFWLAKNLESHGMDEIVANARQAGHTLGNHSYTHADLSKKTANLEHEINDSTAVDKEIYGVKPSYFRCPYGSCIYQNVTRVRQMIAAQRMLHVTWTIDSLDWQDKDPASVYDRVMRQVKRNGRGIILFHDIHPQSYAASTALMIFFRQHKDEYRLRTISQIVRELNSLPPQETPSIFKWLPWGKSE